MKYAIKITAIITIGGIITWVLDPWYPAGIPIMFVSGWLSGAVLDKQL